MKNAFGITRRAAAIALLAAPLLAAHAAEFPSKPIRFIVPYTPGGTTDLVARTVGQQISQKLGQPVLIDNRGGAGGNIGAKSVAEAKPDGYTVLTSQVSIMAVNPSLYAAPGFDPIKNFVPITQINAAPLALVVEANSPYKTFADLATRAKASPGKVTYATPGNGTLSHLVGVVLQKDSGVDMTHVPYKGAGPALTDLLGGQVDVLVTSTSSVAGMVQNGKLRVLAVTSPRRIGVFAKAPTLEELGYANARFEDWYGFFAPAGTPPERVAYLNEAIVRTLRLPEVTKLVNDGGSEVVANTPEAFAAQLRQDIDRWSRIVKLSGAKAD